MENMKTEIASIALALGLLCAAGVATAVEDPATPPTPAPTPAPPRAARAPRPPRAPEAPTPPAGAPRAIWSMHGDGGTDRATVPLSDPSRPGTVKVSLLNGGISVVGYDGKEIVVEARSRGGDNGDGDNSDEDRDPDAEERRAKRKDKTAGMHRLQAAGSGLSIEEEDNVVRVEVGNFSTTVDLQIQVPRQTSLELGSVNDGDIKVEGVSGEIEVNNTNGAVSITDASGSVVAHALNGEVVVSFVKVDPQKSMSFSSMNGDIDVTFPADVHADLRLKSDNGEIYSDFDIVTKTRSNPEVDEKSSRRGDKNKHRVRFDRAVVGSLNGGGPEIRFETFNGDIFVRKHK
jgi:hypothetical protein